MPGDNDVLSIRHLRKALTVSGNFKEAYHRNIRPDKKLKNTHFKPDRANNSKVNLVNGILTFLFIGTLVLTVFEINIYRMTLIHWYIPTSIWLLIGLIATPFTLTYFSEYYKTTNSFLHAVFNICTWGGLVICAIMVINYHFPKGAETQIKVEALNYGHLAKGKSGCAVPYVDVSINGLNKELIFPCDFEVERYKWVNVTVQEGFFGIDILTE